MPPNHIAYRLMENSNHMAYYASQEKKNKYKTNHDAGNTLRKRKVLDNSNANWSVSLERKKQGDFFLKAAWEKETGYQTLLKPKSRVHAILPLQHTLLRESECEVAVIPNSSRKSP